MSTSSTAGESAQSRVRRLAGRGLTLACLVTLGLGCFGDVLFRDRQFGFRDAGYFYYPLHLRIQQEWQAGRWPLWAPEENAGTPLLGYPSAAVLYPGKLVFCLLPYPWAARTYVILHVLLGFAAMRALLRAWLVSATGATLGALSFAFGAPVLSLSCNVIFLVGAAWAPLGFLAADRWLRLRRPGAIAGLTMVLAMQVLGGDPQAASLMVVCASGYAAGLAALRAPAGVGRLARRVAVGLGLVYLGLLAWSWWTVRLSLPASNGRPGTESPRIPTRDVLVLAAWGILAAVVIRRAWGSRGTRGFAPMMGGLLGASVLALAIAGAQVLPVVEFTRLSVRASESQQGLYDIYRFAVHPLQVIEALWPNVYGTVDRGNHSWVAALARTRDFQSWYPSLYLGGLTLVLALATAGFRSGPPWRAWLTGVAVVSLVASFGVHGSPLFWARCVRGWSSVLGPLESPVIPRFRNDGFLRDGDGSVAWFFAAALPGFSSFRFPAKFLVFTALAVSGLAGAGWDRLVGGGTRRVESLAAAFLTASLLALVAAWLGGAWLRPWLQDRAGSSLSVYGPLDVEGAVSDLRGALTHASLGLAVAMVVAASAARRPRLAGAIALTALALDLGLANSRHVVTVPQSVFEGTPRILRVIEDSEEANPAPGPFRVQRVGSWTPREWLARGSPRRSEEIVRWERDTLRPNYEGPLGVRSTFSVGTTELFDYGFFFFPWTVSLDRASAAGLGLRPGQEVLYYPRRGFDLWNTRYFIVPRSTRWESPERGYASLASRTVELAPPSGLLDVRVLRNETALPRAWVVHRVRAVPPILGSRPSDRAALMREILYQNDTYWHEPETPVRDPRLVAWVETDRPEELARSVSRLDADPSEVATITLDSPQRVELTARLETPGLVVVADVYYPGWTLTVDSRPAAILRTNRAMRGVALPAGTHHLAFRYEPASFRIGIGLSILGLVALAVLGVWAIRRNAPG
jgi:hypothetical protein